MNNTSNEVITLNPQDGPTVSMVGDTYRILISGEQTGGAYAAIDMLIPPNGGPGPHAHANIQESFYVIDGEIEVKTKGKTYTAKKGAYVYIPLGGAVHCFKNVSNETAHILCMVMPAGMDKMFLELGKPVAPNTFLPPPTMDHDTVEYFKKVAEEYGQQLFPPDYLD
jgi:quercetin dioxygenase-like cupin family protein